LQEIEKKFNYEKTWLKTLESLPIGIMLFNRKSKKVEFVNQEVSEIFDQKIEFLNDNATNTSKEV